MGKIKLERAFVFEEFCFPSLEVVLLIKVSSLSFSLSSNYPTESGLLRNHTPTTGGTWKCVLGIPLIAQQTTNNTCHPDPERKTLISPHN